MKKKVELGDGDLIIGHVYRGKNRCKTRHALYNDRKIIWRNESMVQYDGPAVAIGVNYPMVSVKKFLEWAKCDEIDVVK